jgi:ABC-type transport system involved in cytochrome bd biosynthesis fused ATPase/permease subunit
VIRAAVAVAWQAPELLRNARRENVEFDDAPHPLLDEVMSNLDTDTEDVLMPELLKYLRSRTVIVVSHRPSTIKHVDRAMKMAHGKVVIEDDLTGARKKMRPADSRAW